MVAPTGAIAVANMPQSARDEANGHATYRFDPTPATASYLVAFAVGPFDVHEGPTSPVPVRVITTRGRGAMGATAATIAGEHLAILGGYFDRPYPYPKLDLVAVPDFLPGAMENPGLITFRDVLLLLDPSRSTNRARTNIAGIIAHELAHQWFGNLVTMAWWDDLWLNEGFATWMSTRVIDAWQPALGARVDAVSGHAGARRVDALATAHAIRQPVRTTSEAMESFDSTTYAKGAAVIGMLEQWLGADAFRDGIRQYLRAHEWGNATAADLLSALSAAAHREVAPVAESFLDQAGVPLIDVALDCEGARPALTLRQRRFRLTGESSGEQSWRVPVCARYPDGDRTRTQCTVMERPEARVELETSRCPAWVHPNANVGGYYYYRLPRALLRQLWTVPDALDPAARLDLLSNLEDLVAAGDLPADDWLDALERLAQDPSPHVQERVVGSLYAVERTLVDHAHRPGFERWALRILRPMAQRVGWRTHPGDYDTRRDLRRSVLTAMGTLTDDLNTRREAERVATEWLRTLSGGDPEITSVAVPLASRRARAARFEAIVAAIPRAPTPQDRALLISALTTFDDLALVRRAYALALGDSLRQADMRSLFGRFGATPEARDLVSRWVMDHWDALHQRLGRNVRGLVWSVANLCDAEKIREAREFFTPRIATLEGADRSLATAVEAASRCAASRARALAHPPSRFTLPAGVASRAR
ncbi:MAG: M1 family aminopeptidase [Polyangiales bacterium]